MKRIKANESHRQRDWLIGVCVCVCERERERERERDIGSIPNPSLSLSLYIVGILIPNWYGVSDLRFSIHTHTHITLWFTHMMFNEYKENSLIWELRLDFRDWLLWSGFVYDGHEMFNCTKVYLKHN